MEFHNFITSLPSQTCSTSSSIFYVKNRDTTRLNLVRLSWSDSFLLPIKLINKECYLNAMAPLSVKLFAYGPSSFRCCTFSHCIPSSRFSHRKFNFYHSLTNLCTWFNFFWFLSVLWNSKNRPVWTSIDIQPYINSYAMKFDIDVS